MAGAERSVAPLLSPRLEEQDGHAPQPWFARTRSATTICCSRVAWFAVAAYCPPPCAFHVLGENCSPPLVTVARVDGPVSAGLTLGETIPVGVGGQRLRFRWLQFLLRP